MTPPGLGCTLIVGVGGYNQVLLAMSVSPTGIVDIPTG